MSRMKPLEALELLYSHTERGGILYEIDTQLYKGLKKTLEAFELLRKAYQKEEPVFYIGYDYITEKYFIDDYQHHHHLEITEQECELLKREMECEYKTEYDL